MTEPQTASRKKRRHRRTQALEVRVRRALAKLSAVADALGRKIAKGRWRATDVDERRAFRRALERT